jgi:Glycosyl hydrolase family 45
LALFSALLLASLLAEDAMAQALSGTVKNAAGSAIAGALVTHAPTGQTATTTADGSWTLTPTSLHPRALAKAKSQAAKPGPIPGQPNVLTYPMAGADQSVEIGLYHTDGRQIKTTADKTKNVEFANPVPSARALAKAAAAGDTLIASKAGYLPATLVLAAGQVSGIQFVLSPDPSVTEYKLNPPDGCMNQFYAKGCIAGDPNSACGGECRVANSCSPPEDPSKGNLPKNFICPRFMMFSAAMMQAAKDDARQYGWGDGSNSPFQYGVVGHDADVGGLDDNSSSCCQCYQLIFETPEPSSPQFPELPQPKAMVVQSFNTAASGPKGFDIFMGAGGYGAFNSCYNDAAFSNTTKFNEFLYQGYPWQNPGSGGISFLRYPVCTGTAWPPTAAGLKSAQCQETLTQQCNQAQSVTAEVTADTRNSCLQTNQLQSLYHQNWKVRAKRVQCPENLTRVTGCRLQEETLPLPLPAVQTPAQAGANGTFTRPDQDYHTTTMQDCCMPTCAWSDWVEGKGLKPVEGWKSFYSCDKTGKPRTE